MIICTPTGTLDMRIILHLLTWALGIMSLGTSGEYIDGNLRLGKKLCARKEDKCINRNYVSGAYRQEYTFLLALPPYCFCLGVMYWSYRPDILLFSYQRSHRFCIVAPVPLHRRSHGFIVLVSTFLCGRFLNSMLFVKFASTN